MSPLTCQLLLNFQAQVGKSFLHLNKKNSLRIPPSYMSIGRCSRVNFSRAATRARGKTRRCTAACSHEVWRWKVTNAYDYKAKCVYDSSKKSLWVAIMNRHKLLARPISNDPKHVHFQHFAWAKVQHAVLEMPLVCTSVWWTTCGSKVLSPASIRSRAWICESCFSQITLLISLYTSLYDLAISVTVTADIYRFYRLQTTLVNSYDLVRLMSNAAVYTARWAPAPGQESIFRGSSKGRHSERALWGRLHPKFLRGQHLHLHLQPPYPAVSCKTYAKCNKLSKCKACRILKQSAQHHRLCRGPRRMSRSALAGTARYQVSLPFTIILQIFDKYLHMLFLEHSLSPSCVDRHKYGKRLLKSHETLQGLPGRPTLGRYNCASEMLQRNQITFASKFKTYSHLREAYRASTALQATAPFALAVAWSSVISPFHDISVMFAPVCCSAHDILPGGRAAFEAPRVRRTSEALYSS